MENKMIKFIFILAQSMLSYYDSNSQWDSVIEGMRRGSLKMNINRKSNSGIKKKSGIKKCMYLNKTGQCPLL